MKKIFTTCAVVAVASLVIFACKKSTNSTPSGSGSTTSSTASTGVNTPFGGMFTVADIFNDNTLSSGTKDSIGSGTAQPVASTGTVNIGNVTVNSYSLTNTFGQYSTTMSYTNGLPPFNGKPAWSVSGGGGFGAFTFTTTKAVPHVSDLHLTVSSFSRTTNLTITHANITADTIKYSLTDDNGNKILKAVAGSSSGYTFTPAMMSGLVPSSNGIIQILGSSTEYSTQGGKSILFVESSEYNRDGLTIN